MVKIAGFPHLRELKDFDFSFQPPISREQIMDFASLRFLANRENIVFLGSSGVGKTRMATSHGIEAAKKRNNTYFIKCNDLIQQFKKANDENRLENRLKNYTRYTLLIIDEIGYLPIAKEESKLFFQLIDKRYEQKKHYLHDHIVTITGRSYRLKDHVKRIPKEPMNKIKQSNSYIFNLTSST